MFINHSLHKIRAAVLLAAAVIAIAAIACSSGYGSTPAATNTAAPAAPTTVPAAATPAPGAALEIAVADGGLGSFLTGPNGHTLYVFLRDAPGTSNCKDNCLQIWPPLLLGDGETVQAGDGIDGSFNSIDTPSGKQVTYNGAPLYYFASDAAAGETKGNLVAGVWFVARPETASTNLVGVDDEDGATYLVGPTGMTLYVFAKDTDGVSNCSGQCLENWPALMLPEGREPTADEDASGTFASITRAEGGTQVTYKGMPLYYYAGDKVPGDTNGDGVGGVWSIATP